MSPLREITGKRVSAFSRMHRPAPDGGDNHLEYARSMDAIDGDLDLVCNWSNCRATLAVIETTQREQQFVTYRRSVAERLKAAFYHVREIEQPDGSWLFQNMEPPGPVVSMDDWVGLYELPLRWKHGCQPWGPDQARRGGSGRRARCATYPECDNNPEVHCKSCWKHLAGPYAGCPEHGYSA